MGGRTINLSVVRPEGLLDTLSAIPGVLKVTPGEAGTISLFTEPGDIREQVAAAAVPYGLLEFSGRQSLEDIFLHLTQQAEA